MLNGGLDEFALDQVVNLLASAGKSGTLVVESGGRTGRVSFDGGKLVGCDVWGAETVAEALTELRRLRTGSFRFAAGEAPSEVLGVFDCATVIAKSDQLLAEWRELEGTIPSRSSRVRPVGALPDATVCLTQTEWEMLTAVGLGATPAEVARRRQQGLLITLRSLCKLVDRGLLELDHADPGQESLDDEVKFELLKELGMLGGTPLNREPIVSSDPSTRSEPAREAARDASRDAVARLAGREPVAAGAAPKAKTPRRWM